MRRTMFSAVFAPLRLGQPKPPPVGGGSGTGEITVFTPRPKGYTSPSGRMTPEQKKGIPEDLLGEIDFLCDLANVMARYLSGNEPYTAGGGGIPHAEFEKARQLIGDTLEGYAPKEEEFLKNWVEPYCPEGVDLLRYVLRESIRKYEEELKREKARPAVVTPSRPLPPVPPAPPTPPPSPFAPTPTPSILVRSFQPPIPVTPSSAPIATQPSGPPQYGIDLQRQIDSYQRALQDFSNRTPIPTQTAMTQPLTPTPTLAPTPTSFQSPSSFQTQTQSAPSVATEQVTGECPPGQFPAYPGGPCRGAVSMPTGFPGGIPGGGMTPAPMDFAPMSTSAVTLGRRASMGGRRVDSGPLHWWGYQQAFLPQLYFARPRVRRATLGGLPVPPGMCCQATPDGGAICSNGQGFPPSCPNKPEPNLPGVAEYVQQGASLVPRTPAAAVNGVCGVTPSTSAAEQAAEETSSAATVLGLASAAGLFYAVLKGLV